MSVPSQVVIEPPYRGIWRRLQAGRVIPFLGAGASRVAPPADNSSPNDELCPPSGSDLAKFLADEGEFPLQDDRDRCDLAKVSSYYVESLNRTSLREVLRTKLNHEYPTGSIHTFLTRHSRNQTGKLVTMPEWASNY